MICLEFHRHNIEHMNNMHAHGVVLLLCNKTRVQRSMAFIQSISCKHEDDSRKMTLPFSEHTGPVLWEPSLHHLILTTSQVLSIPLMNFRGHMHVQYIIILYLNIIQCRHCEIYSDVHTWYNARICYHWWSLFHMTSGHQPRLTSKLFHIDIKNHVAS